MSAEVIPVPGLGEFPLIIWLRDSQFAYAAVHTAHLFGVAVLVGSVAAFDLRVLGWRREVSVQVLAKHLLPLAVLATVLIVPTGLAMFAVHADALLTSRTFLMKMGLLMAGAGLAIAFHSGPYKTVANWSVDATAPRAARACAFLSLAGWIAVVFCASLLRPA
ncbi:MAG: hypothetical protein AAF458_00315 [Pseudomonadota bacterium]